MIDTVNPADAYQPHVPPWHWEVACCKLLLRFGPSPSSTVDHKSTCEFHAKGLPLLVAGVGKAGPPPVGKEAGGPVAKLGGPAGRRTRTLAHSAAVILACTRLRLQRWGLIE